MLYPLLYEPGGDPELPLHLGSDILYSLSEKKLVAYPFY